MLDSLDTEGNMEKKHDALSSWAHSADGYPDDKDSHRLDV